nr:ATP-binding protein [Gemmobacter serpentinus]
MRDTAGAIGITLCMLVLVVRGLVWFDRARHRRLEHNLLALTGHDSAACFSTDASGRIGFQNAAARHRFGHQDGMTLIGALQDHFTSPASVLYRLQSRAMVQGFAREDLVTRSGQVRLAVHRIGGAHFLWRLEEFQDRGSGRGAEALSLPMLVANKSGVILFSNEAMRRLVGLRPRHLDRIFATSTLRSGEEVEVGTANGRVRAMLAEVEGPGERREIYLLPVPQANLDDHASADFEHVPVALIKFAPDGMMRVANRAAREVLEIGTQEAPAFHEVFEGLGRPVADWLADIAAARIPPGAEVLRLRNREADLFFQVSLRRIVEQGRTVVLAVLNDATALKTLEAQFTQSQKMQAIGQLAGGISHDFNNLLTAISGHCDLLLLRHDTVDPEYADLEQIRQNANRAAGLVGQLLAFSRKQTLKPERLDLQEVLSDLTDLLNRLIGEKVSLRLSHAPDLGPIRVDKRQLEQVIMNLVVNARDAMPEGGTIRVETEALALSDEYRRDKAVVPPGAYAVIRVSDTGCGIPPDQLHKVFEPFFTTKRVGEGTGLGLSTAYGIVKQSGGFIFIDSEAEKGTTFHLYFPINTNSDEVQPQATPAPRRNRRRTEGGVVLLVEDEAPVRAFASRALRLRGFTVLEADCAEAALETLEDPRLDIDIFVTDVVMPGLDGPGWVRKALETRPNVRTIFVSGYAEDCLAEHQARIPNSIFLPKPFSLSALTDAVQDQLH